MAEDRSYAGVVRRGVCGRSPVRHRFDEGVPLMGWTEEDPDLRSGMGSSLVSSAKGRSFFSNLTRMIVSESLRSFIGFELGSISRSLWRNGLHQELTKRLRIRERISWSTRTSEIKVIMSKRKNSHGSFSSLLFVTAAAKTGFAAFGISADSQVSGLHIHGKFQLHDLKDDKIQLTGLQGYGKENVVDNDKRDEFVTDYDKPVLKRVYIGNEEIIKDFLEQKRTWEDERKNRALPQGITPRGSVVDAALYQYKEVAFSQSLFSAILSLLVGLIIWQAKDPCTPLVIALFTVVSMSLWSVVQFFSTIKNRPATDAVALLSFNWFILGTLAYPTLPMVGHIVVPLHQILAGRMIPWLGISSLLS